MHWINETYLFLLLERAVQGPRSPIVRQLTSHFFFYADHWYPKHVSGWSYVLQLPVIVAASTFMHAPHISWGFPKGVPQGIVFRAVPLIIEYDSNVSRKAGLALWIAVCVQMGQPNVSATRCKNVFFYYVQQHYSFRNWKRDVVGSEKLLCSMVNSPPSMEACDRYRVLFKRLPEYCPFLGRPPK